MAIDNIPYPESTSLLKSSTKSFYPVHIPVSHWQLRHYISTPGEPDLLYYASGHDIYCLNTASKKRKLVATLPFEARCTASGYGWVCVGGEEEGKLGVVKIDGSRGAGGSGEVDAPLSVADLWREGGRGSESGGGVGRRAASVKLERIGEEIVNSISIHRIQDEESHLDDIVAVLTNNDKTVRIYSLPQGLETKVLDLPFAMNHATISPDGRMLVAVGDFNQAYFFRRELTKMPPQIAKPHNRLTSSDLDWTLTSVVGLHVGKEHTMGYFTTAWSPSGRLVAVGSEGGSITVLDVELLADPGFSDDEAIVAVIPSSRPDLAPPHPGAVRSMMFSPDPWDLLVWAEDQGRICVGDLRTGLKIKQVVHLEPKEEGLNKVAYEDVPSEAPPAYLPPSGRDIDELEADFIRRYSSNNAPDSATAVNFATEYIEARRRQRQQRQDMAVLRARQDLDRNGLDGLMQDDPQGLTAREQQILDSLRMTRQREEARTAGNGRASSDRVNYTTPDMFTGGADRSSTATPHTGDSSARPISEILSSVPDSFPELSRTNAASPRPAGGSGTSALPSLRAFYDDLNSPHRTSTSTSTAASRLPRRRASVILTPPPDSADPSGTASVSTLTDARGPRHEVLEEPEEEGEEHEASDDENPWRTIEEHMTLARGPLFESASRAPPSAPVPAASNTSTSTSTSQRRPSHDELQAILAAERARARTLARQRDRWRSTIHYQAPTNNNNQQDSPATFPTYQSLEHGPPPLPNPSLSNTAFRRSTLRNTYLSNPGQLVHSGGRVVSGMRAPGAIGVRTAGLAMSADGRRLWAACEEGIFEWEVGVRGRGFWPACEPR